MYLTVQDRKSANPCVGHVMSAEWNPYFYEKESFSAVQPKEKDMEKVGAASEEGTPIKSTVGKDTEISKDYAKTIQDEKDVLMEFPKVATDKELKEEVVDIYKEYSVVEKVGASSEEGKPIESIVEKDTEISMDDTKTIQDEKDVLMEVPTAASEED